MASNPPRRVRSWPRPRLGKKSKKGKKEVTFHHHPVHVLHEDSQVVVIAAPGELKPGETLVTSGAFALGQALQVGANVPDPHAGHKH